MVATRVYTLFCKWPDSKHVGFVGNVVSVRTLSLISACHYSKKAALHNKSMNEHSYVPIKLYL